MEGVKPQVDDVRKTSEVVDGGRSGGLTFRRLATRIAAAAVVLLAAESWTVRTFPAPDYETAFRLPERAAIESVYGLVRHVERAASSAEAPIAVFLGASPTWGYRIRNRSKTWPESYETAAREAGEWVNAYNAASNGRYLGDELVMAKRLADDADILFIQLTYHTFSPSARNGRQMRHPELARLLAVDLPAAEARLLGVEGETVSHLAVPVERVLRDSWGLYRHREAIDRRLFGGPPRQVLKAGGVQREPAEEPIEASADEFASFEDLDPAQQMIAVSRYAEDSSFTIREDDPCIRLLRGVAPSLADKKARVVFYMSPLNRELLDAYELVDWKQYETNVAVVRKVVESAGMTFIDYNTGPSRFSSEHFADVSHTTDAGGVAVGRALYEDTHGVATASAEGSR